MRVCNKTERAEGRCGCGAGAGGLTRSQRLCSEPSLCCPWFLSALFADLVTQPSNPMCRRIPLLFRTAVFTVWTALCRQWSTQRTAVAVDGKRSVTALWHGTVPERPGARRGRSLRLRPPVCAGTAPRLRLPPLQLVRCCPLHPCWLLTATPRTTTTTRRRQRVQWRVQWLCTRPRRVHPRTVVKLLQCHEVASSRLRRVAPAQVRAVGSGLAPPPEAKAKAVSKMRRLWKHTRKGSVLAARAVGNTQGKGSVPAPKRWHVLAGR